MTVRDVMTIEPVLLDASASVSEAAKAMRKHEIGDVVVRKDGKLYGILTDRDIAVRVVGENKDPRTTTVDSICTQEVTTISPTQSMSDAVVLMRQQAIRRLPVMENETVVGIVSLGDLAIAMDRRSALGDISAAPPSH